MGRWIRYTSLYPAWVVRLVRPEAVCFERDINLRLVADGLEGFLENHFLHCSFNKGLHAWYEKHNRYSSFEARVALRSLDNGRVDWRGLLPWTEPVRRRCALKELSFRLPFRPTLHFLYMYLFRRGILDGRPGYVYCRLLAAYDYMIGVKLAETNSRFQSGSVECMLLSRVSRWLACLLGTALLIFVAYASALAAAERLLVVRTVVKAADVIVVLGGDGPHRAARAVNLFRQGFAPRVVISGDGDCLDIRQLMIQAGVPEAAIEVECASRNTFENAEFTAPILAAMGARSALLVTSGFHTRRALGCFLKTAPGVGWMSAPVEAEEPIWHLLWDTDGMQIAKEYLKVGWYAWHYGVPWRPERRAHPEPQNTKQ